MKQRKGRGRLKSIVYLRMRHRVQGIKGQKLKVGDLAQIVTHDERLRSIIAPLTVQMITEEDKGFLVIDIMKVIKMIQLNHPTVEIQSIGAAQTIIEVYIENRRFKPLFFLAVWLLLFIGAGLAIMNFHEDVSMQMVHQKLYTIITGRVKEQPLLLQVPYSFGLGIGMILFFNHVFKKRINEEPSPLEVEMFNYQQSLDRYVAIHENKESEKTLHDH